MLDEKRIVSPWSKDATHFMTDGPRGGHYGRLELVPSCDRPRTPCSTSCRFLTDLISSSSCCMHREDGHLSHFDCQRRMGRLYPHAHGPSIVMASVIDPTMLGKEEVQGAAVIASNYQVGVRLKTGNGDQRVAMLDLSRVQHETRPTEKGWLGLVACGHGL